MATEHAVWVQDTANPFGNSGDRERRNANHCVCLFRSLFFMATDLGGGGGDDAESVKEKEEEAERERLEAIKEAEERRKDKHRKMEEEREKMRQDIRDKVGSYNFH